MKNVIKNIIIIKPELRIAISGQSGCGNTTVSTILADILHLPCINYTFKNLAEELNMTIDEIIEQAKTDFSFDKMVDTKQIELAEESSCIIGSRLAVWLLKNADVTVYLYASPEERARRIQKREGGNFDEIKAFTAMRDSEDTRRYKELYNIDNTCYDFVNLIIDTEKTSPEDVTGIILNHLERKGFIKTF